MDPGSGAEEAGIGARKLERAARGSHSRGPFLSRLAPLADEDHVDEARLLRALDHRRQIRAIIREIKMGVRVDEHRQPTIPPSFGCCKRWFAATSARSSRQSDANFPSLRNQEESRP